MKPVRVQPKFKCDFCKRRSTRAVMEKHEKRCYRNPNRFCDECNNTGKMVVDTFEGRDVLGDCVYCAKFDKKMLEEIVSREQALTVSEVASDDTTIPF